MAKNTLWQSIYIGLEEEIPAIVDKIAQTKAQDIYLVAPEGAVILRSTLDLKLLQRETEAMKKTLYLVTTDEIGQRLAEKANLIIKESLPKKQAAEARVELAANKEPLRISDIVSGPVVDLSGWRQPQALSASKVSQNKEPAAEPKEKKISSFNLLGTKKKIELPVSWSQVQAAQPIIEKAKPSLKTKISWQVSFKYIFIGFVVIALAAALAAAYVFLPKAEIRILTTKQDLSFSFSVLADTKISVVDLSLNKIPAQMVELAKESSGEFLASGEEDLKDKAQGYVYIYNEFSSAEQTLVETTRFVSENGQVFRIIKNITVPGAKIENGQIIPSRLKALVVADEPGPDYNIKPGRVVIPGFQGTAKYDSFYGISEEPMSGGVLGQVKIVLQKDIDDARARLEQDLRLAIEKELKEQIPAGLELLESAVKIEAQDESLTAQAGEIADKFYLTIRYQAQALAFSRDDLEALVNDNLQTRIGANSVLLPETQQIDFQTTAFDFDKGEINLPIAVSEQASLKIETAALQQNLAGKDQAWVKEYFSNLAGVKNAEIVFWPFWVKKVPASLSKIKIVID